MSTDTAQRPWWQDPIKQTSTYSEAGSSSHRFSNLLQAPNEMLMAVEGGSSGSGIQIIGEEHHVELVDFLEGQFARLDGAPDLTVTLQGTDLEVVVSFAALDDDRWMDLLESIAAHHSGVSQ